MVWCPNPKEGGTWSCFWAGTTDGVWCPNPKEGGTVLYKLVVHMNSDNE